MSNKPRICVALFHRNAITVAEGAEERLGFAMYHWAILIRPKDIREIDHCTLIDATDGMNFDPVTHIDSNPTHEWWFRVRTAIKPVSTASFLGALEIGKLPKSISVQQVVDQLSRIPLPRKHQLPDQNCATWVYAAIETLQQTGYVSATDVQRIMDASMAVAHGIMANGPPEKIKDRFQLLR
ncbi:hypothetical protein B0A48_04750 [Cryoendolithus antarcticus]|uniref:Uncharacterized protein n=1 Tax=Cryoendolithus antarcticus TaxID=1507870 RepID=A0A1V8TDR7_9PEZI|nr:hypothetical protein B0A48_04750 [Cryoendolithus antarcticus]